MPKDKKVRSEELEQESRGKKSLREEEDKVMETPGGEMAPLSPMASDPVALLNRPEMAHPANASLRAQAVTELQRQRGNTYVQQVIERIRAEKGSGRPLDKKTRAEMEAAFGQDLGDVRVHSDAAANRLAKELRARAFTTGHDVFIRSGEPSFPSPASKGLLGHEMVHVIQQREAGHRQGIGREGDAFEREAEAAGWAVARGTPVTIQARSSTALIQKQEGPTGPEAETFAVLDDYMLWLVSEEGKKFDTLRETLEAAGYKFTVTLMIVDEGHFAKSPEGIPEYVIDKFHFADIRGGEKPPKGVKGAYVAPNRPWVIESPDGKERWEVPHKSIVWKCETLSKLLPPKPVELVVTTEDEIRLNMMLAGVDPEFERIYGELMNQADGLKYIAWDDFREMQENGTLAQTLCGKAFANAVQWIMEEVAKLFKVEGVVKLFGPGMVGVPTIYEGLQMIVEEAKWKKDPEYRKRQIYFYLLRQLAINMNGGRKDGEQVIYSRLLNKTMSYEKWLAKDWPKLKQHLIAKYGPPPEMAIKSAP